MPADMDEMLTFMKMLARMRPLAFDDADDDALESHVSAFNRLIETANTMTSGATISFNERELATVLAALRAFRRLPSEATEPENDIATSAGKFDALTNEEIDELCDSIIES